MSNRHREIHLESGSVMRVESLSPRIFRIRLKTDASFPEPSLIRYGIIRGEWPETRATVNETAALLTIKTSDCALEITKADGALRLLGIDGATLSSTTQAPWSEKEKGFGAEFSLADGERLYGMGDVTRDRIEKRGFRARMWVTNVKSYVPIPVILSNRGWGLSINTTWNHYIDAGHSRKDRLRFWGRRGELDFHLFVGDTLPSLLDAYTDITGRPTLLPLWAYGLTFVCNQQANAREMIDDCLNLRREGIPCDLVGLEPGWMTKYYDYSITKDWHPDRFHIPPWVRTKGDPSAGNDQTFMGAARRLGFKVSLWLCEDYDFSYEEERQAGTIDAGKKKSAAEKRSEDDFEQDEHFGHGPTLMDHVTKPEEPWFEHLKKFVDDGASAFKLDGALQVNEHPDRKWGNGMDDQEMHNLYPALLNKQMARGFAEYTGRRAMIYSSGGYTGIQQFSATWAGDTGGGAKPLASMLNHGLSGHVNTSCDMDVFTPAGIHFGFLQAWSQVCSWAYWRHPWLLGDTLLPIFKYYAKLRYRLIPYLYSAAHVANRTGMPILRAMPLVCPDDPKADQLLKQYMLGDFLLAAAFTNEIHLPPGAWFDFWTGHPVKGPADLACDVPANRGGPLFVKAGAVLPFWPEMEYVGQKPLDRIELRVYPGAASVSTMYEDDGVSLRYRNGEVALTTFTCEHRAKELTLTISPRTGAYQGMPERRGFDILIKADAPPRSVKLDGKKAASEFDAAEGWIRLAAEEDSKRQRQIHLQVTI